MLKTLMQRLLGRRANPAPDETLELDPLTVLAVEPAPSVELIDIDHLYFPWLLGHSEAFVQEFNEAESRMLRALKREADAGDASTVELVPRLPAIIPVLLRSLRDDNVSTAQLARQVTQDAVLVAAVLRQVNSSLLRRATPAHTIEEALAVIGQNGLRILVASVAFKPLFSPGLGPFTGSGTPRVWALAEPCGTACRRFAARAGVDEFEVFLANLLRQVGIIVGLRLLDQSGAVYGEPRSLAFHVSFIHYCRRLAQLIGHTWEFPSVAVAAASDPECGHPVAQAAAMSDRVAKLRVLRQAGALREELVDALLDSEDMVLSWRDLDRQAEG